jgi:hypothetical protein
MVSEKLLPVSHVVYGLRIATNLSVPGLPVRSDSDHIDVWIRLKEEAAPATVFSDAPGDFFYTSPKSGAKNESVLRVGIFPCGKYFGFFYSDGARFAIDREGREVWADWPENYTIEDACTYLMGPIIAFVLRLRGITCLHASAIAVDDRAIVLFGLAGAGKSTTAAAFALRGFSVLSDDVAVLADQGERFLVQPGYPRVNLWPNSVRSLFGSPDALPRITPTWDKRYLALGQHGREFQSQPLPLGTIYILGEREAKLTVPVIEDLAGHEAFTTLVANTYVNYLLDDDMRAREFDVLGRVLAGVPVRQVRPPADPSKVFALCEAIAADARRLAVRDSTSATSAAD